LISIIMPFEGDLNSFKRAVDSMKKQLLANWELLVVNDGSTDGSVQVLQEWAERDSRIRLFRTLEVSKR
jgi:glycosyltransferase involved in cell wall biosynthesis